MSPRVVYKYPLNDWARPIPFGPDDKVVHVGEQDAWPVVWVEHAHPQSPLAALRLLTVVGTGQPFAEGEHVGTVQMVSGLVWHVYDVGPVA